MRYDLFFVAYYKHGAPQHLVAGPFLSENSAQDYIDSHESPRRCVVKTSLEFEEVEQY